jgi:hypothetical protein
LPRPALAGFSGALRIEIFLAETDLRYPINPSAEAATADVAARPTRRDKLEASKNLAFLAGL